MRRAKPGGWYDDFRYRLQFEREAHKAFPSIRGSRTGRGRKTGAIVYTLTVGVPEFDERRVIKITLGNRTWPTVRLVTADGPPRSPHRYADGHLCMWYPGDGPDGTWQPEEGLLGLIQYARVHLFREAYWRRYDQWPGPEAPHGEDEEKEAA
jgi:hypothetical protein